MKKVALLAAGALVLGTVSLSFAGGEDVFNKNCKACHGNGGNIANPKKTFKKADMDANNVKTAADIVHIMRNAKKPMPTFTPAKISDGDAKEVAEYILKTFTNK